MKTQLNLEEFETGPAKALSFITLLFIIATFSFLLPEVVETPSWLRAVTFFSLIGGIFFFLNIQKSIKKDIQKLVNEIRRLEDE